jgi:activator of HSP90 ATPase
LCNRNLGTNSSLIKENIFESLIYTYCFKNIEIMKTIRQKHHLPATPVELYTALTNPFTIELWSGYPATMSTEPGSEFSMFEGDIIGKNLEFKENEQIKQQWYFEGEDKESIVTINLIPDRNNTIIEVLHENVPEQVYEEMLDGWKKIYFGSLKRFFK